MESGTDQRNERRCLVKENSEKGQEGAVRVSNIGNIKSQAGSQGKGGDLQSKYDPTLTERSKRKWGAVSRDRMFRLSLTATRCRGTIQAPDWGISCSDRS